MAQEREILQEGKSSFARYINAILFMAASLTGAAIAFLIAYNSDSTSDFIGKWEFLAAAAFALISILFGLIILFSDMERKKSRFYSVLGVVFLLGACLFAFYCYNERDQIFRRPDVIDSNEELSKLGLLEPVGLENTKTEFSYFNSLVQCLLSIPEFVTSILDTKQNKSSKPITSALKKLVVSYYKSKDETLNVSDIAEEIGKKLKFDTKKQQNVGEYFGAMLGGIKDEGSSGSNGEKPDQLFQMHEETRTTCKECKKKSEKSQIVYSIQATPGPSVQSAINLHYQQLAEQDIDCPECKERKKATQEIVKAVPSKYVFVCLKRTKSDETGEATNDTSEVNVDEKVVLCGKTYRCIGVIFRTNNESAANNYYAAAKRDGKWYIFNDKKVEPFNFAECKKNEATAFFYSRISQGNKQS